MGIAADLFAQSQHLARYQGGQATQSDLRRAVSTAYYSLFHLLIEDAGNRWQGASPMSAKGIQRALDHGPMKNISIQFMSENWRDWNGANVVVPPALRRVAGAFVRLQDERHLADYDNFGDWTAVDAEDVLKVASDAFDDWQSIRAQPIAGDYLLAMLLGKRR